MNSRLKSAAGARLNGASRIEKRSETTASRRESMSNNLHRELTASIYIPHVGGCQLKPDSARLYWATLFTGTAGGSPAKSLGSVIREVFAGEPPAVPVKSAPETLTAPAHAGCEDQPKL